MKRKRTRQVSAKAIKRQRLNESPQLHAITPLLRKHYTSVQTLREYLVSQLNERSRRKSSKLRSFGLNDKLPRISQSDIDVVHLLDSTFVGSFEHALPVDSQETFASSLTLFTQQISATSATYQPVAAKLKQAEIVDFSIWSIFRNSKNRRTPNHLLCHGYQSNAAGINHGIPLVAAPGIPGIFKTHDNGNVEILKSQPWTCLHGILAGDADSLLHSLLTSTGIFVPAVGGKDFKQLSGIPLMDVTPLPYEAGPADANVTIPRQPQCYNTSAIGKSKMKSSLSAIRFARHRMLYARPEYRRDGCVRFGFPRKHVFERFREVKNLAQTLHVMKYVFPNQFGLHNVFQSNVDTRTTSQSIPDYSDREGEIAKALLIKERDLRHMDSKHAFRGKRLPKRLQGCVETLIERMRKHQRSCPTTSLLNHYCPYQHTRSGTPIDNATGASRVSAFCRAYISCICPSALLGGEHNRRILMRSIDAFIRLKRYESMSLHNALQGLSIRSITWLEPTGLDSKSKMSASDAAKRKELLAELVYYLFDSILIPLIRGCFHVTESSMSRNGLCYFRHDAWQSLSKPAVLALKADMFEPCASSNASREAIAKRQLGIGQVRMLPKSNGMRPIVNLRRRELQRKNGTLILGRSVNSVLTPAFSILNFEKASNPGRLGSAIFSVDELFARLQAFKSSLKAQGLFGRPLWFAKVDVRACFDTIPQERMLELANCIMRSREYKISRYARVKLIHGHNQGGSGFGSKLAWRYFTKATSGDQASSLDRDINADAQNCHSPTIYVDGIAQRPQQSYAIANLLREHIKSNVVRIENRLYRQKTGIPQGSILSSLLCAYFYSEMEAKHLGFTRNGNTLMLRLVDDFLLVTTERKVAERFLQTMHRGLPDYGIEVQAHKSRANFDIEVEGSRVSSVTSRNVFPYCGHTVNMYNLDISKDQERRAESNLVDSVTVEYSRMQGQSFYRKTLHALKLQMRSMLLSTSHNTTLTVFTNLFHAFVEVAQKSYFYIRCLPTKNQPNDAIVIKAFDDMIKLSCTLLKRYECTREGEAQSNCGVERSQARWLACVALLCVFRARQTKYREVIAWLSGQLETMALRTQAASLQPIAEAYLKRWMK